MAKDVVCGMNVDEKSDNKVNYKGKIYYFCSHSCQWEFEKDPERFIK
jgi:YHS domain-containing protein